VAIEDRLRRLEDANPDLCERRPCKGPITMSQRWLLPSGDVEVSGERPPPLCDACPERDNPEVRHIEVRYGFPHEAGRDIWEVVDTESAGREGEGRAVIWVVYDDPPEEDFGL
jgi:hypothetical protein